MKGKQNKIRQYMSHTMRKPAFCIAKTNVLISWTVTAQLISTIVFQNIACTVTQLPKIRNFKPLAIFFCCTEWLVSDLIGIPKDCFFSVAAHVIVLLHPWRLKKTAHPFSSYTCMHKKLNKYCLNILFHSVELLLQVMNNIQMWLCLLETEQTDLNNNCHFFYLHFKLKMQLSIAEGQKKCF